MHIYPNAPYIPAFSSSRGEKYKRVIKALRQEPWAYDLIFAMETRALIINQIVQIDADADFYVVCTGEQNQWEIAFEKISEKARQVLPYLEKSLWVGFTIQISFPESWK